MKRFFLIALIATSGGGAAVWAADVPLQPAAPKPTIEAPKPTPATKPTPKPTPPPESNFDRQVRGARELLEASKKKPIPPRFVYAARVIICANDQIGAVDTVDKVVEEAKKTAPGAVPARWLEAIKAARYQTTRIRSISPVPDSMSEIDSKIYGYTIMIDEYLNAARDFFYDRDALRLQIRQQASLQVGGKSLTEAISQMYEILMPEPQFQAPQLLRPKVGTKG